MNLPELFKAVGKQIFVKYYYYFKDQKKYSTNDMVTIIQENYTEKSKKSRTGHARMIFNNSWNIKALEIIIDSNVPIETKILAQEILNKETCYNDNNNILSYERLIISYLETHGKTTIDELYKYISSIKNTGKTGKRYLREVVTNRYQGSDIFEYDNPYVWLKNNDKIDCTLAEELNENVKYTEGTSKTIVVNAYERNVKAKQACIEYYGNDFKCQICGFKFADKYGKEFQNKIHIHHIKPISEIGKEYKIDPKKDLIPVCPNCHMILHSKGKNEVYSVKEVKKMIENNKS